MLLSNIDVDNIEKLKSKDKKIIKEYLTKYFNDIVKYLEKYKNFPSQDIALKYLKKYVDIDNSKYILKTEPENKIILKIANPNSLYRVIYETTLGKLKNNDDNYILDKFNIKYKNSSYDEYLFVIKKRDKIYSAFSYNNSSIDEIFTNAINENKSLDKILFNDKHFFIGDNWGKEYLLLIKYYLDKKKENPNEEVYLDLKDYTENYLEKYNKYTKPKEFLENIPNFIYINSMGYLIYKLGNEVNIYNMEDEFFNKSTLKSIKDKYSIYKLLNMKYKKMLMSGFNKKIKC